MSNVINAERQFKNKRDKVIAELMAIVDVNMSNYYESLTIDSVNIDDDENIHFEVTVKPYSAIEFIDLTYEIVKDEY